MDDKTIKNDEIEIDLSRLFGALANKAWLIGLVAIVCAVAVLVGTIFFITPQYQSRAKFYVNNSSLSSFSDAALSSITSADISASRGLVKTYIVILQTRETLNDVIDYAGVDRTYGELKSMISASAVDSTEIFEVVVTSEDPEEAEKIANAIAYILPNRIKDIIDGTSAKVVESAVVSASPSSPNYTKNTMVGFLVGLVVMMVLVVLREILDTTVRNEEDITQSCRYPVLAAVPNMMTHTKGGYYHAYDNKEKDKGSRGGRKKAELVGSNISFAAAESYKLLRTKVQFSFADDSRCHVIGISSALTGEGKSLSSVNLAYAMSQLGERVLLIDCDMRRPSVAEKLPVQKTPGLSDYLTNQCQADNLIQLCGLNEDAAAFHVISAGHIPPNPTELLSSRKMESMLSALQKSYTYILLDLPPVGEVSDALAAAKLTDGMLVVARQDYGDRNALSAAIRQLEFVNAKILGVVFNCTSEGKGGYGNKYGNRYYKKYYKQYYKKYDTGYAAGGTKSKKGSK